MEKTAKLITQYFIRKNIILKEKADIYCYGLKLIFADIINFSIIILLGFLLNRIFESIAFLIALCGIRRFSGGFHAKTFWLCRLSMMATYICVMEVVSIILHTNMQLPLILLCDIIVIIFISIFAPVEHPNKPLSQSQRKQNKRKAVITTVFLSFFSIFLVFIKINLGVTISITLVAVMFLMIISMVLQKGGKKNV